VLPWSAFPDTLYADVERFREHSLKPDWFEDEGSRRAVRVTTADQRDRMLRRLASAEVLAGADPVALTNLGQVCGSANLRRGLEFMMARNDNAPNKQIFEMAMLAQTVARHWADLPVEEIETIAKWGRKFRPTRRGMTEKNRQRLRQFTSDDVIRGLVVLPEQVFAEISGEPATPTNARLAQRAVMLALLTVAPMRLKNLRTLNRSAHFRRAFSTDDSRWHLVLPAAEVKNDIDLEYPIPPHLMAMIDRYMAVYQPVLASLATAALFPGRKSDTMMSDSGIRSSLMGFVDQRLGLTINPHLFRHLGALIFLKANPGQHETVRQLLGHKNIQTTTEFYSSFETDEAMRRVSGVLSTYREDQYAAVTLTAGVEGRHAQG
jgi:site-specific recombinase XerD